MQKILKERIETEMSTVTTSMELMFAFYKPYKIAGEVSQ